jgi:outer membrane protein OmpA-like peptidoglycan-associated protein
MAALPPAAIPEPKAAAGERLRLAFAPGSAALGDMAAELDATAARLGPGTGRVQIFAHATPTDESASSARRLALKRALAVRGYLIERGVPSDRIDVRALGDSAGATDAVDIVVAP